MKRYAPLWRFFIGRIALPVGGAVACLLWPPVLAFEPRLTLGLALVAAGALALLVPLWGWIGYIIHSVGAALVWGVIGWCAVSQTALVTEPLAQLWALRLLPVLAAFAVWGLLRLPGAWQRRALLALVLPSALGLGAVARIAPHQQTPNFTPVYIVADSRGTLYVTDKRSPVVRVFSPDGALRAKLRPGVASVLGLPGRGFEPPGPYNDPDRIGANTVYITQQPQYPFYDIDGIRFCGLAIDSQDRLYVPDAERDQMLRFTPDGRADLRWKLSNRFVPTRGCVAVSGDRIYLASGFGLISQYDFEGRQLAAWTTPEPMRGDITAAPDGKTVYVLGARHIYAIDTGTGVMRALPITLPTPSARVYETIAAAPDGRLLYTNLAAGRIDIYCDEQTLCGTVGGPGDWPGQFGTPLGLFQDGTGNVYVSDGTHRVVQRFSPSGHVSTIYWSPDDDEIE